MPTTKAPRASKSKSKSIYSVHPGVAMIQKWIAELPEKTGRSLDQWLALVKKSGPADEKACRDWLKEKHGLGTNAAWWIAERALGGSSSHGEDDPESYLKSAAEYVENMYSGAKAALRPLHDELIDLGLTLGGDVKICPCKTIVPFYRNHVFAEIKPATRTRIDFGLALAKSKKKPPKRVVDTGGAAKKDRITHRIVVESIADIDDELKCWLQIAYDLDA